MNYTYSKEQSTKTNYKIKGKEISLEMLNWREK